MTWTGIGCPADETDTTILLCLPGSVKLKFNQMINVYICHFENIGELQHLVESCQF